MKVRLTALLALLLLGATAFAQDEEPPFFKVSDTHYAKTWLLDPRAPHVEPPAAVQELHARMLALTAKGGTYGERE